MTARRRAALPLSLSWLTLIVSCSIDTTGAGEIPVGEDAPFEPADDDEQAPAPDDDEQGSVDAGGLPTESGAEPDTGDDDSEDEDELRCQPGTYTGTFECTPASAVGTPWQDVETTKVTGTLQFALASTDDEGNKLELRMGQFTSTSALVMVAATIEGELKCGKPFEGQLRDATYSSLLMFNVPFKSPLKATFDDASSTFTDGTWQIKDASGTQCMGTWTAARSGP